MWRDAEAEARELVLSIHDAPVLPATIIIPHGADAHVSRDHVPFNFAPTQFEASLVDDLTMGKLVLPNLTDQTWLVVNDPSVKLKIEAKLPPEPQ